MATRGVLAWLLDGAQPGIRAQALTQLLGRSASDPDVREARTQVPLRGWGADILATRDPHGWWVGGDSLYLPKYRATNWQLLVLADLGASRASPAVRRSVDLWTDRSPLRGGGVGGNSKGTGHLCYTGNMAWALLRLGYRDDARVVRALEWLVDAADPKGGWSCFGSGRNLDSWEALAAFAEYPRDRWTGPMERAIDRGVEFFLDRELHRQGTRYAPWFRTHYPIHYYYDLLVGLDIVTALGRADDPRLRYALDWLRARRRPDGRWNLDAVHPDVEGAIARWFAAHPNRRPAPLVVERPGRPSRAVTLRAMRVLARVDGTVRPGPS